MLSNQELAKIAKRIRRNIIKWSRTQSPDTLVVLFQPLKSPYRCILMK